MSFYTSLSGLKAAQTDLSVTSNNVANAGSLGFKRSRAYFGDLFSSAPTQTTITVAGQGVRLIGIGQQFSQGSMEATDRALDLAIAGDGFFVVKGDPPGNEESYTRNGYFALNQDRKVTDVLGNRLQLLPVDANGQVTSTNQADMFDFVLPETDPGDAAAVPPEPADPNAALVNVTIDSHGVVVATYGNGQLRTLGGVAMSSFSAIEGLRPIGDAHWQSTADSGEAIYGGGLTATLGSVRSGSLEQANVDLTQELVNLITAQRNFQANAQAIETANNMTQTIMNMQV